MLHAGLSISLHMSLSFPVLSQFEAKNHAPFHRKKSVELKDKSGLTMWSFYGLTGRATACINIIYVHKRLANNEVTTMSFVEKVESTMHKEIYLLHMAKIYERLTHLSLSLKTNFLNFRSRRTMPAS